MLVEKNIYIAKIFFDFSAQLQCNRIWNIIIQIIYETNLTVITSDEF